MKLLLTLTLVFCASWVRAQIVFDDAGKLTQAPDSLTRAGKKSPPPTKALPQLTGQQQRALAKELQRSFRAIADTMTDNAPLRGYYERLWGQQTTTNLAASYRALAAKLAATKPDTAGYAATPPASPPLDLLDALLASQLATSYTCYGATLDSSRYAYEVKLLRTDLAKQFLLDYYTQTHALPANRAVRQLTRDRLRQLISSGEARQRQLRPALDSLRGQAPAAPPARGTAKKASSRRGRPAAAPAQPVAATLALLDQSYRTHAAYLKYEEKAPLFTLLRGPWLQAWLWRYTTLPTLNPLPFVDDAQVPPAGPDSLNSQLRYLEKYVRKTLASKPAGTKDFGLAAYADDVRFLGRERALLTDTAAFRKARAANGAAALSFRTTRTTLNAVSIPQAQPHDHYVTLLDPRKSALATPAALHALTVDTRVVFSVHNLAAPQELRLVRLRATTITDQSAMQRAIAEGLDGLTLLKGGLGGLPAKVLSAFTLKQLPTKAALKKADDFTGELRTLPQAGAPASPDKEFEAFKAFGLRPASMIEAFWEEAYDVTANTILEELRRDGQHPFMTLLPDTVAAFQPLLFYEVQKQLGRRVTQQLRNQPNSAKTRRRLLGQVVGAYLQLFAERVARRPVLDAVRGDSLFLANSLTILRRSTPPPTPAGARTDELALYHSEQAVASPSDSTRAYTYGLQAVSGGKATQFATYSYRTGRRHAFQLSAGLAYTFRPVSSPEASVVNGQVQYTNPQTRFRVYGGVNLYPGRLFLQDNRFLGKASQRLNLLVAVGIPEPLDNFYFAPGYDLGPGIRVNAGLHLHGYRRYEVYNNQLVDQRKVYEPVAFASLGIDPVSFVKAIILFF